MKIYLVGGAVRDKLLGLPVKEKDYVVVGATVQEMQALGFRQVGKEFPVFLHPETGEEYALARAERKVDVGYKGFTFDTATTVTLEEDLKRRDLTLNAMAMDEHNIIDPYGGRKDIENKILRHVSEAFQEDPVRILRVGRFLARYANLGFSVNAETKSLMKKMVAAGEVNALVAERVWKELERTLTEKNPEKFFEVLANCGALAILFPQLEMNGPGMAALIAACKLSPSPKIRFAALLYQCPMISQLCKRYRAPNAFRELATLTAKHHPTVLQEQTSASVIIDFFNAVDIYRRPERFEAFLVACAAIAHAKKIPFKLEWWHQAAFAAKNIDIPALLKLNLSNKAFGEKLKHERREKIEQWLSSQL